DLRADERLDLPHPLLAVDEEAQILLGGQPHHDPEAMPRGRVEQGTGGLRVRNAAGVDPVRGHLGEVPLDHVRVVVLVAVRVGGKRAVGHAADVELRVAGEEEFAPHGRPDEGRDALPRARGGEVRGDRLGDRCGRPGRAGWRSDRHADLTYAETCASCAGVTLANHSIVRRSPSRRGTVGLHPSPAWAFRMSGCRRAGSSWGSGRWTSWSPLPTSEATVSASSSRVTAWGLPR